MPSSPLAFSPLPVLLASPPDQREYVRATEAMKENWFDCSRPGQVRVMDPMVAAGEKVHYETVIQLKCGIWSIKSPDLLLLCPVPSISRLL